MQKKRKIRHTRFKQKLTFVGTNCSGISSKWQSFNKLLSDLKPAVFFGQETKLRNRQKFKVENPKYTVFRLERVKTGGGGIVIGALDDLKPVLVNEGDDESEALTVQISVNNLEIRCVVGYGACESDRQAKKLDTNQHDRKLKLWEFLENEVIEAENKCQGLVIQMDANASLGPELLKNDPNNQNSNGRLFANFLQRNPALIVVNNLDLCKGLITRRRKTIHKTEEAVLDFFLVNSVMLPFVEEMIIDDIDEYTLSNHAQNKKNGKSVLSDHRPLFLKMNLEFTKIKPQRKEQFNFKSEECQKIFTEITDVTNKLTKCFENNVSDDFKSAMWEKELNKIFHQSFQKKRIINSSKKSSSVNSVLLEERRKLIKKMARNPSPDLSIQITELEEKIGKHNIQMNTRCMKSHLLSASKLVSTQNTNGSWALVRKTRPKYLPTVPVGKKNNEGKMVTDQESLKKLNLETFLWRLRDRPIRPDLVELQKVKSELFETILKSCSKKRTSPWTQENLEKVLDSLKKDKCRDPNGLINEIFATNVAGKNLKGSLLMLFNTIKGTDKIPAFMKIADISAIYRGKGSNNDLNNERGIFVVSIFRSILMKLLYNDNIETIENQMSTSQVGGRKNMNVRNHIWVLNGIIQDVLNRKGAEPIDVQILDIKQCFDALWPEECLSDLFQYGIKDNTLNILYDGTLNTELAIRTPVGLTERKTVKKTVMQGDVWAPTLCATTIDSIGKECLQEKKYLYKYREHIEIPPLAMVDDVCDIYSCGVEAVKLNSYLNYKISSKKLQCGTQKCKKMHIGSTRKPSICRDLHIDGWK